jgi:hypothetical protein
MNSAKTVQTRKYAATCRRERLPEVSIGPVDYAIYAAAGIGQFIIVNLVDGRIEVYEEPKVAERCYQVVRVLSRGDTFALHVPGGKTLGVPVADWLPELSPEAGGTA